ncbi:MAG: hypothetical protein ALECFALPRED_005822 [Alectoria fallacina]|uniref:Srp40 C-terminal domain-containing protein n=1 Tax=Alectoria fallacina TaxID=1903189 RepID=A0A8H3IN17_9LECA|nr:MAG: hypothetical protein ALECFALPRED_005822 [Alectoria fallacina]
MAPKSKKPPVEVEIKPEFELPPPGSEPPRKKKKKNAPDKPQPEWMFPPDEENPVLNPKPESEAHRLKDEKERGQAIKFLQYKSVTAPMKTPPPDLLLTLVGAFLTSYGFNNTSRIYTTQLQSRKKLDDWKTELGGKLPKGFPDLVKIFKDWYKIYQEKAQVEETSSSDSDDSDNLKAVKKSKKAKKIKKEVKAEAKASEVAAAKVIAKDITSSSGSESSEEESDSDVEMENAAPAQKSNKKPSKISKIKSSSPSTSSSSSDSDADDEKDNAGALLHTPAASKNPTVNGLVNSLKRKESRSSSSESDSESDISSSVGVKAVSVKNEASSPRFDVTSQSRSSVSVSQPSNTSSSSSDTSSSGSESAAEPLKPAAAKTTAAVKAESESSSDSSSSEGEPDDEAPKPTVTPKAEASSSSSSSSNSRSSESESELDFSKPPKPTVTKTTKVVTKPTQVSSDSSVTLQASSVQKPSAVDTSLSSTSSSDSSTSAGQQDTTTVTTTVPATKRKRSSSPTPKVSKLTKKRNTPFQRVPLDTLVDPKMASNAYRSYDYADRAHQDLSVTKGKGFTKEKNKKKRGSYKGGAIDVSGGKGVKFED